MEWRTRSEAPTMDEDEGPSVDDVRSPGVSSGDGDLEVAGTTGVPNKLSASKMKAFFGTLVIVLLESGLWFHAPREMAPHAHDNLINSLSILWQVNYCHFLEECMSTHS